MLQSILFSKTVPSSGGVPVVLGTNSFWDLKILTVNTFLVPGTIAPAREVHNNGFGTATDTAIRIVLANLNLVIPVTSALLVIIVAIIFLCYLKKKGVDKGQCFFRLFFKGTIAPPVQDVTSIYTYLPWIPKWIDLNVVVPTTATIVVIIVGIIVVCFAWSRRVHENGQTRLRGTHNVTCIYLI